MRLRRYLAGACIALMCFGASTTRAEDASPWTIACPDETKQSCGAHLFYRFQTEGRIFWIAVRVTRPESGDPRLTIMFRRPAHPLQKRAGSYGGYVFGHGDWSQPLQFHEEDCGVHVCRIGGEMPARILEAFQKYDDMQFTIPSDSGEDYLVNFDIRGFAAVLALLGAL